MTHSAHTDIADRLTARAQAHPHSSVSHSLPSLCGELCCAAVGSSYHLIVVPQAVHRTQLRSHPRPTSLGEQPPHADAVRGREVQQPHRRRQRVVSVCTRPAGRLPRVLAEDEDNRFLLQHCTRVDANGALVDGATLHPLRRPDARNLAAAALWPTPLVFALHREVWVRYKRWVGKPKEPQDMQQEDSKGDEVLPLKGSNKKRRTGNDV